MVSETETTDRPDEMDFESMNWSRGSDLKEGLHMMVSHHPPSLFGHCLRLTFMGRSIYFCARCSGIYGGLFLGIPILLLIQGLIWPIQLFEPKWVWFLIAVAFGMSTVTDWVTQRLTPRKTTVRVRALTGLLSGIGLAITFLLEDLLYMLAALAIMGLSVGGVSIAEGRRSKKAFHEREEAQDIEEVDDDSEDSE